MDLVMVNEPQKGQSETLETIEDSKNPVSTHIKKQDPTSLQI